MDHAITLRIPEGFDRMIPVDVPVTDDIRRAYVATILAVFVDNQHAPVVADALVRLNGGAVWPKVLRFQ
jgi:hypothetical protein